MLFFRNLLAFLPVLPFLQAFAAQPAESIGMTGIAKEPIPEWVEVSEVNRPEKIPTEDLDDGVYYLALEHQVHVEEQAEYRRTVELIASSEGTETSSEITVNFDPAFQTVAFHRINIHRDGEVLDRLEPERFRVLEREKDLESRILDGSLTAFYVLEDVRVGDIVEYAYTVRGRNPAFDGRYYDSYSVGWSVPLRHQLVRILSGTGHPIRFRVEGADDAPETRKLEGGVIEIRWERRNPAPIQSDSKVPHFHTVYPWIQFSERDDWQSVAKWAAALYAGDFELPPDLEARVAAIGESEIPTTQKVAELLQLVQEDVRYLGVEMGTGAYHPRPPDVVYKRRFGDCKDKTLLLHSLLSHIGVESTPALVNTGYRRAVEHWLPSPTAFDHVILAVDLDGNRFWVDPTRSYQRGPLEARGIPPYGFALLASPTETALTRIEPSEATRYEVAVTETYKTSGVKDPVELTVRTSYSGFAAEDVRGYFASTNREAIGKSYTEFLAESYPDIELLHPIAFEDDPEKNHCTTVEYYRIGTLWSRGDDEDSTVWAADIYPSFVANQLTSPSSSRRKTPYALSFPRRVTDDIEVHLWEDWKEASTDTEVVDDAFRFSKWMKSTGKIVKIHHEYESLQDHVPAEAIASYHTRIEKIRDRLNWTFTTDSADKAEAPATSAPGFEISVPTIAISLGAVLTAIAGGIGFSLVPRKKPPLTIPPNAGRFEGLGGWLVLPQIGLWLTPVSVTLGLIPVLKWCFNGYEWDSMRSVVEEGQFPALQGLLYSQLFLEIVLGIAAVFLLVQLYQRRYFTPVLLIALFLAGIANAALEVALVSIRTDMEPGVLEEARVALFRESFVAMIWVPYFLVSKRVKATFRF